MSETTVDPSACADRLSRVLDHCQPVSLGKRRQPFHGHIFVGRRFDCGDKLGFIEANVAFALEREDLGPALRQVLATYGV